MQDPTPEVWRDVVGHEGLYEVSDLGRIRRDGRVLRPGRSRSGYLTVGLHSRGPRRSRSVHTLVLEAFVGVPGDGMQCRHLNGNPLDNRLVNLAWGTPAENVRDQVIHGTHAEAARDACRKGHPFSRTEQRLNGRSQRVCGTCKADSSRRQRARAKTTQGSNQ